MLAQRQTRVAAALSIAPPFFISPAPHTNALRFRQKIPRVIAARKPTMGGKYSSNEARRFVIIFPVSLKNTTISMTKIGIIRKKPSILRWAFARLRQTKVAMAAAIGKMIAQSRVHKG